jgi:hypothetical protein
MLDLNVSVFAQVIKEPMDLGTTQQKFEQVHKPHNPINPAPATTQQNDE